MSQESPPYFLRSSGRITGPYSKGQLEELRQRGRFMAFHEVSTNRILWVPAMEEFADLFGGKGAEAVAAESQMILAKAVVESHWFYLDKKGNQSGPVPESQLRELVLSGQVKPSAKIWTSGMPAWESANQVLTNLEESRGLERTGRTQRTEIRIQPTGFDPALNARAMRGLMLLGVGLCLTPFYPFFGLFGFTVLLGLGQPIRPLAQTALILLGMAVSFTLVTLFGFFLSMAFSDGQYTNWIGLIGAAISTGFFLLHFHSFTHTVSKMAQSARNVLWAQIAAVLQLVLVLGDLCIAGSFAILALSRNDGPVYYYGVLGAIGIFFFFIVLIGLVILTFSVRQALPAIGNSDRASV